MIKVLDIGYDRKVFEPGSAAEAKVLEQAALFEELHLIVFSTKVHGLKEKQLGKNAWAYPTDSSSRFSYISDAARIGKQLVFDRQFTRGKSVITAQDPFESGVVGTKIKKRWRIPLEVQLHTDPFSPYFKGFLNWLRKRMAKRVVKEADRLRVVTEDLKLRMAATYSYPPEKIDVLPIYVDVKKVEDMRPTFDLHARYGLKFILLTVARLTEEKNISMMLEVMRKLAAYEPLAGLVIVGDGSSRGALESRAKALGLGNRVIFLGWQEELASFYKSANAYIQTSLYEGYGLSLIEAGLAGLPLITTPVGIAKELKSGVEALICPQGDTDFMYKAIYDLIQNNALRETLASGGRRALEKLLVAKEDYLKRYQETLEKASTIS